MYLTWTELADKIRRMSIDEQDCAACVRIIGHGYCCVSLEERTTPDPLDGGTYYLSPETE